jgi:hypothetical protein
MDAVHAPDLELIRQRRSELREAIGALEQALAAPAPGRIGQWCERVHVALVELSADLRTHVSITEDPGGLFEGIVAASPRHANAVAHLCREHREITAEIDVLLAQTAASPPPDQLPAVRERGTRFLGQLVRHRQHSADVVHEAFEFDLGGET